SAFFALALDTGGRSGELLGLSWDHVDFERATVTFARTIVSERGEPIFNPTKTGIERTVTIDVKTLDKLKAHRASQAAVKMRNRPSYADQGLVFAREPMDLNTSKLRLGDAMTSALDGFIFNRVVKAAGVRHVTMHGTRHTVATLMLNAGTPVHEVSARLGHA